MGTLKVKGGPGVHTTGYGNTIEIAIASNAPAVPFKITNFPTSGTWTKDLTTTFVTLFGWCGGGGGSGTSANRSGGSAGSQGEVFYIELEPAASFGATTSITIGAGGTGGTTGNNGSQGGVTSIGSFFVPGAQNNQGMIAGAPSPEMPLVLHTQYPKTFYCKGGAVGEVANGASSVYRSVSSIQNSSLVPTGGGGGGGDS